MIERSSTVGRISETGCVVIERSLTVGRVVGAGCVEFERAAPVAVFQLPVVLVKSELCPVAVFL